jgi:hypothetical protein
MRLVLAAIVVLAASSANAGDGLKAQFQRPAIAGQAATLTIQLAPDCCPAPDCAWLAARGTGSIRWGDQAGFVQEAWPWHAQNQKSERFPPVTALRVVKTYLFDSPGRYAVDVKYTWIYSGCDVAGGTLRTRVAVDVYPERLVPISGGIGIYFDPEATQCSGRVEPGTTLYVVANMVGEKSMNVSGADFRIRVSDPEAVHVVAAAASGWIQIGEALGEGVTLARKCDPDSVTNPTTLLTLRLLPARQDVTDVRLFVERSLEPSNPTYPDAMLLLCNEPTFTPIRAGAGFSALLNPAAPASEECGYTASGHPTTPVRKLIRE